jgi:fluoride exporter
VSVLLLWGAVALLGGAGAVARFRLDAFVQLRLAGSFPTGTLTVNVLGSFVLGVLTGAGVAGDWLLLAGTAVLGSFTTFSTWMLETERLGEEGDDRVALLNLGVSIAAGTAAAIVGWAAGSVL